jgi:hypothetical protein
MAANKVKEEDLDDQEDTTANAQAKDKKYDTGSAALEKVTDFAEEKELKSEAVASVCNSFFTCFLTLSTGNGLYSRIPEKAAKTRS